eukprot:11309728-Alexandrium_andersonii.AAC.1
MLPVPRRGRQDGPRHPDRHPSRHAGHTVQGIGEGMRQAATAPPADGGREHRRGGGRLAGRGRRVRTEGGRLLQRCRRRRRAFC